MSNAKPVYFDYMATTPVDPRVKQAMVACLDSDGVFGNAASTSHVYGWQAEEAIKHARQQFADSIHASSREIVFCSGATESINLALKGAAEFYQKNGKHIISLTTEHKAVLDTLAHLESQGFRVTYVNPEPDGRVDLAKLEAAICDDTILMSTMWVNNEIGVIQDIHAIATLAKSHGVIMHCDAVQALGKVAVDVTQVPVDLLSFSGHKIYGPKGVGVLYVRRKPRVHLAAQIHGGGHEFGLRSGTLATHQIVGMGQAAEIAATEWAAESQRIAVLRDRLWHGLQVLDGVHLNGCAHQRVAHNLNVCFDGVEGEALMLSLRDLAISSGSACNSANLQPSHVLLALGLTKQQAASSLRLSLGRWTRETEVDQAIASITREVKRLRSIAPETT